MLAKSLQKSNNYCFIYFFFKKFDSYIHTIDMNLNRGVIIPFLKSSTSSSLLSNSTQTTSLLKLSSSTLPTIRHFSISVSNNNNHHHHNHSSSILRNSHEKVKIEDVGQLPDRIRPFYKSEYYHNFFFFSKRQFLSIQFLL